MPRESIFSAIDHKRLPRFLKSTHPDRDTNIHGSTALHVAAYSGNEPLLQTLLEGRANPNAINSYGFTPIMMAAMRGHPSIVKILLDLEVIISAKDVLGKTVVDYAAHSPECLHLLTTVVQITTADAAQLISWIETGTRFYEPFEATLCLRLPPTSQQAFLEWCQAARVDAQACFAALYGGSDPNGDFAPLRWLTGGAAAQPRSGAYGPWPIRRRVVGYLVSTNREIARLLTATLRKRRI